MTVHLHASRQLLCSRTDAKMANSVDQTVVIAGARCILSMGNAGLDRKIIFTTTYTDFSQVSVSEKSQSQHLNNLGLGLARTLC